VLEGKTRFLEKEGNRRDARDGSRGKAVWVSAPSPQDGKRERGRKKGRCGQRKNFLLVAATGPWKSGARDSG